MTLTRPFSGIALAVLTLVGWLASPQSLKAEDLVDFLWGGSAEYGGGRSVTSFDPQYKAGQIIVSFSDRRLYLITKPGQAITYPVAVPMGEARWQGVTFISDKKINPPWTPTPDMMRQNPRLPRWVPGGHPMNPLGVRAMYLGSSSYRIHGTDAPWTIGQPVSHGCIRLTNDDVLDLYPRVSVGTRVTVTWQKFTTTPLASNADYSSGGASSTYASASSSTGSADPGAASRHKPTDSSIGTFSFWDDEPAPTSPASPTPPTPAPTKKKYSSAASPVKKTSASSTAPTASTSATPATSKASTTEKSTTDKPTPEKSTDATPPTTPTATKASASADEGLPVQKASAQVQ